MRLTKQEILKTLDNHPIFHLATCENNIPHVRHMLLYRADENGIIFYTSFRKDICQQILSNNNVELCFYDLKTFLQIRVSGKAIAVVDQALKEEIVNHPTREYLRRLVSLETDKKFYHDFVVFRLIEARAHLWFVHEQFNDMKNYKKEIVVLD